MSRLFLKKSQKILDNEGNGEGGIRTHGTRQEFNGFQDRLLKPLGHPSKAKYIVAGFCTAVKQANNTQCYLYGIVYYLCGKPVNT